MYRSACQAAGDSGVFEKRPEPIPPQPSAAYIGPWLPSPAARTLRGKTKTEYTADLTLKPLFPWAARNACTGYSAQENKQWTSLS